ncbi:MAG: nucleotidyltransferase family protein [Cyanothece sp. SIO2G6]|nr:nucleotidyltransferase family protein [Cyanothece sp. SIO2G6]
MSMIQAGLNTFPTPNLEVLKSLPWKSFCHRWHIAELAVFGSILRDDFSATSDIDILVTFESDARQSLMTLARIKHELEDMTGREIDILTRPSIEQSHNTARKRNILESAKAIYVV